MTKNNTSKSIIGRISFLVLVCFFLSGLTGLIYEVLWIRMITKIIGGAPFAVSIILTVFMGGLGVGSYIASRTIDRIKDPMKLVKIYGILEIAICLYGLAVPFLLRAFEPLYAVIYNRLFEHFMFYNFLTFVGCAVLLCIPVICMGATLPILCKFYVTRLSHLGTHAGRLYGLNTIGAALGALICGFWLIDIFGVTGTLFIAVGINAVIGIVCVLAGTRLRLGNLAEAEKTIDQPVEKEAGKNYKGALVGALLIFAVSGFCSMASEVIWTKLLGLLVGPTTYSFTIVLVTFILGLALGSMIFGKLADMTGRPMVILIVTQICAAFLILFVSQILGNSQLFFAKLIYTFQDSFGMLSFIKALALFGFMALPTLCLGATFPLVSKIYTQSVTKVGRSIGYAYTINTIGAVLGSFCAGFILVPLLGKEDGLSLVVGFQLLTAVGVGIFLIVRNRLGGLKIVPLAAAAAVGIVLCYQLPMWNRQMLSLGRYHRFDEVKINLGSLGWSESLFKGAEIFSVFDKSELVYYGDGIGGFTTVLKYVDAFGNIKYTMVNGGKPDASSRGDMETQTLLAHFPMMFHKNPEKVMVLGLASGVTAGEALNYPIERVDVIDISDQVVEACELIFSPWNSDVLSDSRTRLIIQDGRAHLQLTDESYDVIISEPSNPWMAGLATLFTQDFFELVRDRLTDDGIFVQWIHAYQMNWEMFSMIGRTFTEVFPNSLLAMTSPSLSGGDYLIIGFKGDGGLDLSAADKNLIYNQKSNHVTLTDPRLLYRMIVAEDLGRLFGAGPMNTDKHPRLEFAAPKLMYHQDSSIRQRVLKSDLLTAKTRRIKDQVKSDIDMQMDFVRYSLSLHKPYPDMIDTSIATKSQRARYYGLMADYSYGNALNSKILADAELAKICVPIQKKYIEDNMEAMPDKAFSYFHLGNIYLFLGDKDSAIAHYITSIELNPKDGRVHHALGGLYYEAGRYNEAIKHYAEEVLLNPYNAEGFNAYGVSLLKVGRVYETVAALKKAMELDADYETAKKNLGIAFVAKSQMQAAKGDIVKAVKSLRSALQMSPNLVEALNNLAWILATKNDSQVFDAEESIRLAERACVLSNYKAASLLDTLAVSYAAAGRFPDAISTAAKAIHLAEKNGNKKVAEMVSERLKLYRTGKSYSE